MLRVRGACHPIVRRWVTNGCGRTSAPSRRWTIRPTTSRKNNLLSGLLVNHWVHAEIPEGAPSVNWPEILVFAMSTVGAPPRIGLLGWNGSPTQHTYGRLVGLRKRARTRLSHQMLGRPF